MVYLTPDPDDIFEKICPAFSYKRRYPNAQAADAMILRQSGPAKLKKYHCKVCLGWHLASIRDDDAF